MVKPFNDFLFNNGIGKVGLVETDLVFIIKITDKQDGIRLATVAQIRSFRSYFRKYLRKLLNLRWKLQIKILILL
jgi:hypothetical protein